MLFQTEHLPAILLLLAGFIFSIYKKKLTLPAALAGLCCGTLLYSAAGYTGLLLLTCFFSLGTAATSWGRRQKLLLKKPEDAERRKSSQVFANAGAATLMAILLLLFPSFKAELLIMLAASLASATADTLSSELGMLYGKRFYNCLSWKKEAAGLDGVISLEGTLIGAAGAALIALITVAGIVLEFSGLLFFGVPFALSSHFILPLLAVITFSGALGNFADSVFGAALERREILNNDLVNFLSTLFASGVALVIILIYSGF